MPISDDFSREERIKRLRKLALSGTAQLLTLHDAIPGYIRADREVEAGTNKLFAGESPFSGVSPSLRRDWAISTGYLVAEGEHGAYSKVYKWLVDADNSASRNLSDELFRRYAALAQPSTVVINTRDETSVEDQITALSDAIEQRLSIFAEQLTADGEYEDVSVAVRDAPGGWPHLRGGILPDSILDGYLARMRRRRTKSEISDAIGAAKEIVEATLKSMAAHFGVQPAGNTPDLADWWKVVKPHLANAKVEKALGSKEGAVIKLLSSQVSTIATLGELRNKVGTGHGKTEHPAGLTTAHALLAVDTAHTLTRFLVK